MKAKGFRVFAVLFILVGVAAGVITSLFVDALLTRAIVIVLCTAIGVVLGCIFFAIANNKEKRERIRASMEAVEDASIFDPIEEPAVEDIVLDDVVTDFEEIPEFLPEDDTDLIVEPIEEIEVPKTKYQMLRDKIVEKTPITNEQIDKAEKIGKIAIPVAAAATVVLMAAKLAQYRKQEIRRRTFFDWLG